MKIRQGITVSNFLVIWTKIVFYELINADENDEIE